jgi:hypothetical protein
MNAAIPPVDGFELKNWGAEQFGSEVDAVASAPCLVFASTAFTRATPTSANACGQQFQTSR